MTTYDKIGAFLGAMFGATSDSVAFIIHIRAYITIDNIYIQTAILAALGGACGYIGTKGIETIHKMWKGRKK